MKPYRGALLIAAVLSASLVCLAQGEPKKPARVVPEFEKMKTLVGQWETKGPDGKPMTNTYRLISGGSAIVDMSESPSEHDMITVFHTDGATLMATHYCAAKNQPRYVASSTGNPNVIEFKFKDGTNLQDHPGHMRGAVITFIDNDHHTAEWTWRAADGKEEKHKFEFTRKK